MVGAQRTQNQLPNLEPHTGQSEVQGAEGAEVPSGLEGSEEAGGCRAAEVQTCSLLE